MTKKLFFLAAFLCLGMYMSAQTIEFVNNPNYTIDLGSQVQNNPTVEIAVKNTGTTVVTVNNIVLSTNNVRLTSENTFELAVGETKVIGLQINSVEGKVKEYIIVQSNATNSPELVTKISGGY